MKVGFIGLGKLGRDAAEVLAEKHDVTGYDPNVDVPGLSGTQEQACKGKDVVLIAVQTPHDPWHMTVKTQHHIYHQKILITLIL